VGALVILTGVTWLVYAIFGQGFLSAYDLFTLGQLAAEYLVIGLAQLAILALGRMNLAVGSIGVIVVMTIGWLVDPLGLDPVLGILIGLIAGTAAGALMGWLELRTGLNSFVVTLAMASVYSGAVLIVTGGNSFTKLPRSIVDFGSLSLVSPYLSLLLIPAAVLAVVAWYVYNRTATGWKILAVGARQPAAELSGIRVGRILVLSFAISGVLSGVAAVMELSRVAAALPSLGGDWLLTAFIVPVLGGTALRGGSVSVGGSVMGAIFLASINSGLVSLNVPANWQQFVLALVLLAAVIADQLRRRGRRPSRVAGSLPGPNPVRAAEGEASRAE
jgi:ribose transport system permease protein